jgi:LPXTG-motif cell wall-anchored protein
VTVGEDMYDVAMVTGVLSQREDIEFKVVFAAYERPASGAMSCAPDTEIEDLGDAAGVVVRGPGRYESRHVRTTEAHIGLGGYVETLVMIEQGETHVVRVGECGAPSEAFEVLAKDPATPLRPPLASTGGSSAQPFLLVSGILLLAAALTAVLVRRHRGRRARVRECRDMAEALE